MRLDQWHRLSEDYSNFEMDLIDESALDLIFDVKNLECSDISDYDCLKMIEEVIKTWRIKDKNCEC